MVASIVNRQKEEIIRSVKEMVSTKLQKFEALIKESHQDLAESVSGGIVDPYNFKKEMSNCFNSIALKRQRSELLNPKFGSQKSAFFVIKKP